MKYKIGDEVLIKPYEEMLEEFGLSETNRIRVEPGRNRKCDNTLPQNRIFTITTYFS